MDRVTPAMQATALIVILSAIAGSILALQWFYKIDRYPGLESRISQYYSLESQNKWKAAYPYFAPGFRKNISQQYFISKKKKDTSGWQLLSFEIDYATKKEDKVKVKMELIGEPRKSEKQRTIATTNKTTKKVVWSIWEKVDGEWYAWQTSARDIKSFNYDVALN